jgi:aspartate dehydrogenase
VTARPLPPFSLGVIGYGAIGHRVLNVLKQQAPDIEISAVLLREGSPRRLTAMPLPIVSTVEALHRTRPDLVLECAGQAALAEYGPATLAAGTDLVVASIGALADVRLSTALRDAARDGHAHLLLPAGAVGGLDALAAMRLAGPISVLYRSRKPPVAWLGTPAEKLCDLHALTHATPFYRGTARHAALDYPKNANVAAAIGLAGAGLDETEVELVADPRVTTNTHEIEAEGPSGRMFIRLDGLPDPMNPKTSMLTAYSLAQAILRHAGRG